MNNSSTVGGIIVTKNAVFGCEVATELNVHDCSILKGFVLTEYAINGCDIGAVMGTHNSTISCRVVAKGIIVNSGACTSITVQTSTILNSTVSMEYTVHYNYKDAVSLCTCNTTIGMGHIEVKSTANH